MSYLEIFLFLRYLNFCPDFVDHVGKRLDKKAQVDFKIYDVTKWDTNNCNKNILSGISKSKGNKTMKFGQLIEYNAENEAGKLVPDLVFFL